MWMARRGASMVAHVGDDMRILTPARCTDLSDVKNGDHTERMLGECDDTVQSVVQSCYPAKILAHDKNSGGRVIEAWGSEKKQAVRYGVEVDQSIVEIDSSVSMRSITIAISEVQSKSTHIDAGTDTPTWTVAPDVVRSDRLAHFLVNYDEYCPDELICKTQFELLFTMSDNYDQRTEMGFVWRISELRENHLRCCLPVLDTDRITSVADDMTHNHNSLETESSDGRAVQENSVEDIEAEDIATSGVNFGEENIADISAMNAKSSRNQLFGDLQAQQAGEVISVAIGPIPQSVMLVIEKSERKLLSNQNELHIAWVDMIAARIRGEIRGDVNVLSNFSDVCHYGRYKPQHLAGYAEFHKVLKLGVPCQRNCYSASIPAC